MELFFQCFCSFLLSVQSVCETWLRNNNVHAENALEPTLEGSWPLSEWFLKAFTLSCGKPACNLLPLGLWTSADSTQECRAPSWPQDGSLSLHVPCCSPPPPALGVSESSLCHPQTFQERDSLPTRPSLKKRTVGLNVRKQRNSKKRIQFPQTTCSLSLLSPQKSQQSCVHLQSGWFRIAKHPSELWIRIPLSLCATQSQILMSENKLHKLHYLSAFSLNKTALILNKVGELHNLKSMWTEIRNYLWWAPLLHPPTKADIHQFLPSQGPKIQHRPVLPFPAEAAAETSLYQLSFLNIYQPINLFSPKTIDIRIPFMWRLVIQIILNKLLHDRLKKY